MKGRNMNTKVYYVYKFLKDFMPIYPIYVLMFEESGLSISKVSLLLIIWSATVVVFEIPTGVLADHWSRKKSLLLGIIFKATGYLIWIFASEFSLFALGFVLWGMSESLCSGSEEALLYDCLKSSSREKDFSKVYGEGNFFAGMAVACSSLGGGFLSKVIGFQGVLIACIVSALLAAVFVTQLKEVNLFRDDSQEKEVEVKRPIGTFLEAVLLCVRHRILFLTISILIFVIGTAGIIDEYDPIIAKYYLGDIGLVGVWVSIRYLIEAMGAKYAHKCQWIFLKLRVRDEFRMVVVLCILSGLSLLVFAVTRNTWFIPLYAFFYFCLSTAGVLQEEFVQKTIEEQGRSTVHSVISLINNLFGIVFLLIAGIVFDMLSISIGLVLLSVYVMMMSIILFVYYTIYSNVARQRDIRRRN